MTWQQVSNMKSSKSPVVLSPVEALEDEDLQAVEISLDDLCATEPEVCTRTTSEYDSLEVFTRPTKEVPAV